MKFVIQTQSLENYGAHSEDGKFVNGNAYWKMKGGSDYIVSGLTRIQDAVAFVSATLQGSNDVYYKELPVSWTSYDEWLESLSDDEEYREYQLGVAIEVSP